MNLLRTSLRLSQRKINTILTIISFLSISAVLIIGCAEDSEKDDSNNEIVVRIACLFNKDFPVGKKLDWVAKELEKRSDNRFKCQLFLGGVAGGEKENLEDLLLDNLELMAGAGSYFYHYCPEASVIELPLYEWKDRKEAKDVITGYWPKFVEVVTKEGFYPVGLDVRDYWGFWYREPVTSLDDIKGAKFRSVNGELWIEITKLYGAIPNPMPYADAYMAFKTGVCDGVVSSLTNATAGNWQEVLKCFVDTRLILCESFMLTSNKWLDDLPEDLRHIFLEVCQESGEMNLIEAQKKLDIDKQKIRKAGVTILEHDEIDASELYDKALQFREEYMKDKGPVAYQFYKDWMKYVRKATGRQQP